MELRLGKNFIQPNMINQNTPNKPKQPKQTKTNHKNVCSDMNQVFKDQDR